MLKSVQMLVFLFVFSVSLQAIDVQIKPQGLGTEVTNQEIDILQGSFLKNGYRIEAKDAEKYIAEKRYLAEEYLSKNKVPEQVLVNARLELEKHLADYVVRDLQRKSRVSETEAESYYVSHKDEFIQPGQISTVIYRFESFEEGLEFYNRFKEDFEGMERYAQEHNLSAISKTASYSNTHIVFRKMIEYHGETVPMILPPTFFFEHYSILYVKSLGAERQKSFEEVKGEIIQVLQKKAYERLKSELLKPYFEQQKSHEQAQ